MSTFGVIIPGRPVDTNFQQVDTNKFLVTIPQADTINHVVVFLTGLIQIPAEMAGCIYFSLPDPNAPPTWHYLGYLTSDKPSAIYKLSNLTQSKACVNGTQLGSNNSLAMQSMSLDGDGRQMNFNYIQAPVLHVAQIGISVEPITVVRQMVPAVETVASKANTYTEFVNKTASNLFNYCSSFSRTVAELVAGAANTTNNNNNCNNTTSPFQAPTAMSSSSNQQYVPLSTIQTWYENYTRRLSADENFWRSLN